MKKATPFTLKVQTLLIALLLISFVFMGQAGSQTLFEVGAVMMIFTIIMQIDFGNMSSELSFKQSIWPFWWKLMIVAAVFAGGIFLAPYFVDRTNKDFVKNFVLVIIFGTIAVFTLFIIMGTPKKKTGALKKGGE